jgi:hypothetical protein
MLKMHSPRPFGAAVAAALALCFAAAASAVPQIRFDKETFDFGRVKAGEKVSAAFTITNSGDAELRIESVKSSCGCTIAQAGKQTLAPGESTNIEAVFTSTGFSGQVSKTVTVTSNDPERSTVLLSIKGNVVPLAVITPSLVNFGNIKKNAVVTQTISVTPTEPSGLNIVKVEPVGKHVTVTGYRKVESPLGASWQVFLLVKAGDTPGRVMESVRITTDAPTNPLLNVTVYGNVVE